MGMGHEDMVDAMADQFGQDMEQEQYERRVVDTGARRLAYLLHRQKVISDYVLAEWLYPEEEAMEQAEKGALPDG